MNKKTPKTLGLNQTLRAMYLATLLLSVTAEAQKPVKSTVSTVPTPIDVKAISIGRTAPSATVGLPDGKSGLLSSFRGETGVIILFGPKSPHPSVVGPSGEDTDSTAPLLTYALDSTFAAFGFTPSQRGVVAIDRAGFIRYIRRLPKTVQPSVTHSSLYGEATRTLDGGSDYVGVGQKAPDFIVFDMNGARRRLADLRGRKHLLLTFFPKCFTFNCANQLSSLRDVALQLKQADVEVWGISTDAADGKRGQKAFAKHLGLPFPLLPDENRNLCLLFGAVRNPLQMASRMSVFIGKDGNVRWIDKQMNPRTHGADVLARLQSEAAPQSPTP